MVLGNDITTPVAINEFEKAGFDVGVRPDTRVNMVLDHFVPNKDIKSGQPSPSSAAQFADQVLTSSTIYDVGEMGVEHALLPEKGIVDRGRAASSAPTATPVPTARWARSPPASAPPIWPPAWPTGDGLVQGPRRHQGRADRVICSNARHRQGRHPAPDRSRSASTGALYKSHGVHRRGRQEPDHGRPPLHLPTWPSKPVPKTASSLWTK